LVGKINTNMKISHLFFLVLLVLFFPQIISADVSNTASTDTLSDTVLCSGAQSGNYKGYQYLGQGLSGKLSQVDIKLLNAGPVYYGKRVSMNIYQSDTYLNNFSDIILANLVWQQGNTFSNSFNINSFDGIVVFSSPDLGSDYNFIPAKHYYLVPTFYTSDAGSICQVSYLYGSLDSNSFTFGEFKTDAFVKDIYFKLYGLSQSLFTAHSSVLFLPGVESSRLYKQRGVTCTINCEDQLWEPNLNSDAEVLFMTEDGKSVDDSIYTRDVVGEAYGTLNIYKSFVNKMGEMKSVGTIADYSSVPYDWRLSFEDVLASGKKIGEESGASNISYLKSTSTPYILQVLGGLASKSQNGKVTIVAHSNGGLLAKALLKKLADTNDPLLAKIDKLILVAVPQLGTPSAITALLNGYDQGIPFSISPILSNKTTRQLGQNLPSGYNLLPSASYFTSVSTPVVMFDASTTPDWISKYGASVGSQGGLHTFLTDSYGRVASSSSDTDNPVSLRDNLLTSAEAQHVLLDSWIPPASMEVVEIAGWGIPTTVSGAKYSKKDGKIKLEPKFTIDGDGTVVTPSALWTNGVASTTRYWVDLKNYNVLSNRLADGHVLKIKHKDVLEIPELLTFVTNAIASTTSALPTYFSTSSPSFSSLRLIYSLHSPLTLDIYDNLGNHTGVSTTTGKIEEQVAGTYFLQFRDVKYIFTNTTTPINIVMSGYDSGTFTFTIEQKQGDNTISTVIFQDIPTATTTKVTMSVAGDINTLSNLKVDSDNNGTTDITLAPVIGSIVTYTPPAPIVIIPPPVTVSQPVGNGPPVAQTQNIQIQISTTTEITNIATSSIIISTSSLKLRSTGTTTPVVAFQRSDLKKDSKGQTLGTKTVETKPKETPIEVKLNNQTAQVVSSNPQYISWYINLWKKSVNWLVAIFK